MQNRIEEQPKFIVQYRNVEYVFDYGSEVYIFHTGIYNDVHKKGLGALLNYTHFVHNCYLKDSNRTPLGALADYIAQNWERVRQIDVYDVLDEFYLQGEY